MHGLQTIRRTNEAEVQRIIAEGEEARRKADAKHSEVVKRAIEAGAANKAAQAAAGQPSA